MSWKEAVMLLLFFPLAGSGCLPNTLRCSDRDVARQPHHPRCCSASGTQVGAYVDLTLKEQQCWGVEGGLPGKILDWVEAQGARPYLNHHRQQTETPWGTVRLVLYSKLKAWLLSGSASSQQHNAALSPSSPDYYLFLSAKCCAKWERPTGWPVRLYCGCRAEQGMNMWTMRCIWLIWTIKKNLKLQLKPMWAVGVFCSLVKWAIAT